jgi:glycosyltransferase involved in cell wall biosynthesis
MDTEVTIVMPVRNQTAYFRQALDSALAQTVPVKIIVHDSSPTDAGFEKIIGTDLDRVKYCRFYDGVGMAGDWNRAMSLAQTDWISFLHRDDLLLPNAIEALLEAKKKMPGKSIYFGLDDGIDQNGVVRVSKSKLEDHKLVEISAETFALTNQFSAPGVLLNRKTVIALGGFASGLQMTLDWDLWVRLTLHSGAIRTNVVISQYRDHFDPKRGTTVQELSGAKLVKMDIQLKRNLARLKAKFPEYTPPANPGDYLSDMARGDLCVKGKYLSKRARYIYFLFVWRGRKLIHPRSKLLAYLTSVYLTGLWIAYSYVRPYRQRFKRS